MLKIESQKKRKGLCSANGIDSRSEWHDITVSKCLVLSRWLKCRVGVVPILEVTRRVSELESRSWVSLSTLPRGFIGGRAVCFCLNIKQILQSNLISVFYFWCNNGNTSLGLKATCFEFHKSAFSCVLPYSNINISWPRLNNTCASIALHFMFRGFSIFEKPGTLQY